MNSATANVPTHAVTRKMVNGGFPVCIASLPADIASRATTIVSLPMTIECSVLTIVTFQADVECLQVAAVSLPAGIECRVLTIESPPAAQKRNKSQVFGNFG